MIVLFAEVVVAIDGVEVARRARGAGLQPDGRLLFVDGQEKTARVYDVSGVKAQ
jgi:hypothetical protein